MGLAPVARIVRKRHSHATSDADYAQSVIDQFAAVSPIPFEGQRILELGPGSNTGLLRSAAAQAVGALAAFDTHPYLSASEVEDLGIDYRTDAEGHMPWPSQSFDVIWSHSVLEHVEQPGALIDQSRLLLRPGGIFIALIDLGTHLGDRKSPEGIYDFLGYPEWMWRLMTSNRSVASNRLRYSHWIALLKGAGFELHAETLLEPTCDLAQLRGVPYLAGVSDIDLMTRECLLCAASP